MSVRSPLVGIRVVAALPLLLTAGACTVTSTGAAPLETLVTTPTTLVATTTSTTTTTTTTTTLAPVITIPSQVQPVSSPMFSVLAVGKRDGLDTINVQARLTDLGFWSGALDGDYGIATTQAVMAFQKYVGLEASGSVDQATADALNAATERARAAANTGTLVEVDKGRQLLFIVKDGATLWVFNTSTGSEIPYEGPNAKDPTIIERGDSVTPNGLWKVDRERPDGWWEGDLGKIYRPKYFKGGVAIHGMTSVPNYPASHGCVRVSVPGMDFIWESGLVPVGMPVWVHE